MTAILAFDILMSATEDNSNWMNMDVSILNMLVFMFASFGLFYLNNGMMKDFNDNQEFDRRMSIFSRSNEDAVDKVDATSTNQLIPPIPKPKKKLLSYGKSRATKEKEKEEEKRKERQWWGGD